MRSNSRKVAKSETFSAGSKFPIQHARHDRILVTEPGDLLFQLRDHFQASTGAMGNRASAMQRRFIDRYPRYRQQHFEKIDN